MRKLLIIGIISILLVTTVSNSIAAENNICSKNKIKDRIIPNYIFEFNSHIRIEINTTNLQDLLRIGKAVTLPVKIIYWTDVPENFLKLLPWPLRNIIIFGSIINPMQTIHLDVINEPEWTEIYFSQSDIIVDIPFGDIEKEATTYLILTPIMEDHDICTFQIRAESQQIGRINSYQISENISFKPKFIPTIYIEIDKPIIYMSTCDLVKININVTNYGYINYALVECKFDESVDNNTELYQLSLEPSFLYLEVDETKTIILNVLTKCPPGNWDVLEYVKLNFTLWNPLTGDIIDTKDAYISIYIHS